MKRTDPESVGELLRKFFADRNLVTSSLEGSAMELWRETVGPYAQEATEDVYIRSGVLYVTFSISSVRADVMMRRNYILSQINSKLGRRVLRAIVLR
ncbi:MAG: DciA family protein [Mucinivorans sp.]